MLKNGKNDFFFYLRQIHFGISGKNRIDLHTSTKTYLLITNRRDSGSWFNGHPQEAPLGGEKWPNRSIPEQPSKTMKWWRKKLFWASLYVSQDIHLDQMEAAMPHLWALRGLRGCYSHEIAKMFFRLRLCLSVYLFLCWCVRLCVHVFCYLCVCVCVRRCTFAPSLPSPALIPLMCDGLTDIQTDAQPHRRTDTGSYRDTRMHFKQAF